MDLLGSIIQGRLEQKVERKKPVSKEWDFADRHYKWFGFYFVKASKGGKMVMRKKSHFGYLFKMAKKYGVWRCEEVIGSMKHDGTIHGERKDLPPADRIPEEKRVAYFNAILQGKGK